MNDCELNAACVVVFDLDDTLYKEVDFVNSAYREIAKLLLPEISKDIYSEMLELFAKGESTLDVIKAKYSPAMSVMEMVEIYRYHAPQIPLSSGALPLLQALSDQNVPMGVITDGRTITQRNKLAALGIEQFFVDVVISEEFGSSKPSVANFEVFSNKYPNRHYYYIADNYKKDFVAPNILGWISIAIKDDGRNIHKAPAQTPSEYLPKFTIDSLLDVMDILKKTSSVTTQNSNLIN